MSFKYFGVVWIAMGKVFISRESYKIKNTVKSPKFINFFQSCPEGRIRVFGETILTLDLMFDTPALGILFRLYRHYSPVS